MIVLLSHAATPPDRAKHGRSWNLAQSRFVSAAPPLQRWGILNFSGREPSAFIDVFLKQAADRGMSVTNKRPKIVNCNQYDEPSTLAALKSVAKDIVLDKVRTRGPSSGQRA